MLARAESGEVTGIMFVVKSRSDGHALGLTGVYAADPSRAIGAAERLKHRIHLLLDTAVNEDDDDIMAAI